MKKKTAFLLGIVILISSLFINLVIVEHSDETDLTFCNIEALAEKETPGGLKPTCVESGYICTGIDAAGNSGRHPGLVSSKD